MWFAGLVPSDTPCENLTEDPPPGVGPYMITESVPNRQFVLEKNPNFPDLGRTSRQGTSTRSRPRSSSAPQRQAQDVISGELDYMQDPPPADLKPEVKAEYSDRYEEVTTAVHVLLVHEHRVPPFDKQEIREAVNFGLDKPALARLFAGELAPGCSFLPPGVPGYDEALDVEDCPWGNPNEPPDLEQARQMIEDAGEAGDPGHRVRQQRRPDRQGHRGRTPTSSPRWASRPSRRSWTAASTSTTIGSAQDEGPDRLRQLVPGLPAPEELHVPRGRDSRSSRRTTRTSGTWTTRRSRKGIAELNQEPEINDEVTEQLAES